MLPRPLDVLVLSCWNSQLGENRTSSWVWGTSIYFFYLEMSNMQNFQRILHIWQGVWHGANMQNVQEIMHIWTRIFRNREPESTFPQSTYANMQNLLEIVHICTIPRPLPNIQNFLIILHIWHLKIKKVNECFPNSAGFGHFRAQISNNVKTYEISVFPESIPYHVGSLE